MNKQKINLKNFIDSNQTYITLIGVFIAVLALSFSFIHEINPAYAGYLALLTCFLSFMLITVMVTEEDKSLSLGSLMFLGALVGIVVLVFLVVKGLYNQEYDLMFKLSLELISFGIGAIIAIKFFNKIRLKTGRKVIRKILLVVITILIFIFIKPLAIAYAIILGQSHLTESLFFNHYLGLLFGGFIFVAVMFEIEWIIELGKYFWNKMQSGMKIKGGTNE